MFRAVALIYNSQICTSDSIRCGPFLSSLLWRTTESPTRGSNHIPGPLLRFISLFIPHPVVSTLREYRGEDRRILLEDPIRLSDEEDGVTAVGVSDALAKGPDT